MRLLLVCAAVTLLVACVSGQSLDMFQLSHLEPGVVLECGAVADTFGHVHHYFMGRTDPMSSDCKLWYERTDFYGHVLTDTVRLNVLARNNEANQFNIQVVGDGAHSWCLYTDVIYGQANRRGLFLTGRDSNGEEILPVTLIRREARNFSIILVDSSRFAFSAPGGQIDSSQLWLYTFGFPPYSAASPSPAVAHSISLCAYPNPFNSTTRVRFDLLKRQHVKLDIYDVQGRQVRVLMDEVREAGRQELRFDGEGFASGLYFVRLKTASMNRTEKLLLLK